MGNVVIIGADHHNTLGVIRSLGEKGIKPYVTLYSVDKGRGVVGQSKYVEECRTFAKCNQEIIEHLVSRFKNPKEPVMLIGTSDEACTLIDKNKKYLNNFIYANCSEKSVSYWMDKNNMNDMAKLCGLDTPGSYLLHSAEEIDYSKVNFPCIVKPLESAMGNKRDITICNSKKELAEVLDRLKEQNIDLLIQDFITAEYEIGIMGCSFYRSNKCWIPDVIIKERFSNKSATYARVENIQSIPELKSVADKIETIVQKIGYKGIFDFDLLYSGGKFYFIEMNLRNGAYGYALSKAGANFAYKWYIEAMTGRCDIEDKIRPLYLMSEFSDFKMCHQNRMSIWKWLKEYKNSVHMVCQFRDFKPAAAYFKKKIRG